MSESKKTCFVVTPIGNDDSPIRRHIDGIIDQAITPALEEKYEIDVAHRKYEIGSINDRVIKSIYNSDLVIANLTGLNPNVMFELAIRYSFGKPAIVIAEEGTKLPFDIVDENTIFYINDPSGANELKGKISEFEKNIHLEKKFYGPVYKAINTIPLYKEVESGEDVSSEKLLSYVINRLDSIEKILGEPINKVDEFYRELILNLEFTEALSEEKKRQVIEMLMDSNEVMTAGFVTDGVARAQMITQRGPKYVTEWKRKIMKKLESIDVKCCAIDSRYT